MKIVQGLKIEFAHALVCVIRFAHACVEKKNEICACAVLYVYFFVNMCRVLKIKN